MKFGVFTDLHYDVIPDGDKRLYKLLQSFREEKVDFILELGDLCNPTEKNQTILKSLKSLGVPCYFSLGNHNIDFCSPETALNFLGLQKGYY
jgi:predicted phosphodiesterase